MIQQQQQQQLVVVVVVVVVTILLRTLQDPPEEEASLDHHHEVAVLFLFAIFTFPHRGHSFRMCPIQTQIPTIKTLTNKTNKEKKISNN
jgi:hypothetical protein